MSSEQNEYVLKVWYVSYFSNTRCTLWYTVVIEKGVDTSTNVSFDLEQCLNSLVLIKKGFSSLREDQQKYPPPKKKTTTNFRIFSALKY